MAKDYPRTRRIEAELLRGEHAGVADDDHHLLVDDDWLAEAKLFDATCYLCYRMFIAARVACVGNDRADG